MSDVAIAVAGLSKKYLISHERTKGIQSRTLRDALSEGAKRLLTRSAKPERDEKREEFWALRNVSFEVDRGDRVGIIGKNGAGKSTLLKILSRITKPTLGGFTTKGRVSSLLEVGTGFHQELTGRENVYLNGAILGMSRKEIGVRFDEIVDFAGIENFLDTPVKRYSSGMYVRLAFAVAAHLEPDILIVDEVLAVGDSDFQKKCLGKMQDVSQKEGRTVLFVSHNMQAIVSLCSRAIEIQKGVIVESGDSNTVVQNYLTSRLTSDDEKVWDSETPGDETLELRAVRLFNKNGQRSGVFQSSEPVRIQLEFNIRKLEQGLVVGFDLTTAEGVVVMRCYHNDSNESDWPKIHEGSNIIECELPAGLLNAGTYVVNPRISIHCVRWIVFLDSVIKFDVELTHGASPYWNVLGQSNRPGVIAPIVRWRNV